MRATKGAGYWAADFALQARREILFFAARGAVETGAQRAGPEATAGGMQRRGLDVRGHVGDLPYLDGAAGGT
jgi:hypothetical protein